jgi:hypothetical protein
MVDEEYLAELAAAEDPALADHRAGDLTLAELVVSVIFLIILFPIGLLLLIIFIVSD